MNRNKVSRRHFIRNSSCGLGLLSLNCKSLSESSSKYRLIDNHIHLPSSKGDTYIWHNVLSSADNCKSFFDYLKVYGIDKILGQGTPDVERDSKESKLVTSANNVALYWRDKMPDFIIPTCSANPNFFDISLKEMKRMRKEGVAWLGEFTSYMHNYKYDSPQFIRLIEAAYDLNYIVSIHASIEQMTPLLEKFPKVTWNLCHFNNSHDQMKDRFELGSKYPNMLLDTSGSQIERMGMLELAVEKMSADRILFGSDFPINDPGQAITRIEHAFLSENDKKKIFGENLIKKLKEHGASL
jgi:predicted TIM-barrel fold metal-dependent hydrolase